MSLPVIPLNLDPLLGPTDPPVFRIERPAGASPVLLTADHAGRAIPQRLGRLNLSDQVLDTHVAWDLGVDGLALALSARLDAFLILHNYSRLVIDANRPPGAPDSIVILSEHTEIAANVGLSAAERRQRQQALFDPYHHRIASELEARSQRAHPTVLVSLHSFTPVYAGVPRPWHVGVLHGRDDRLARRLAQVLEREQGLTVGVNVPYAVSEATDHTVVAHGERRRLAHVELEIRQDLLATPVGQGEWSERLALGLTEALVEES